MKTWIAATLAAAVTIVPGQVGVTERAQAPPGDCVVIGTPKPPVTYVYEHSETNETVTQVTNMWESVTDTGSRLRTSGPNGVTVQGQGMSIDRRFTSPRRSCRYNSSAFRRMTSASDGPSRSSTTTCLCSSTL